MAAEHSYTCTACGKVTTRSELFVKKVLFTSMGAGSSTLKARVIAWLCEQCLGSDLDWMRPPNVTPSERVSRKAEIDG